MTYDLPQIHLVELNFSITILVYLFCIKNMHWARINLFTAKQLP